MFREVIPVGLQNPGHADEHGEQARTSYASLRPGSHGRMNAMRKVSTMAMVVLVLVLAGCTSSTAPAVTSAAEAAAAAAVKAEAAAKAAAAAAETAAAAAEAAARAAAAMSTKIGRAH